MMHKVTLQRLTRLLTPILFLIFFWQTRIAIFEKYALYDYSIWFLYATDIVIVFLILGTAFLFTRKQLTDYKYIFLIGLFLIAVSIISASNVLSASAQLYRLFRIILGLGFVLWLVLFLRNTKYPVSRIIIILTIGFLPLGLIGFSEIMLGKSLGLKLIGEWDFSLAMPGIATLRINDFLLLRPYATFPHPNVFGAIAGMLALYWILREQVQTVFVRWIQVFMVGALIISFSRTSWIGFGVVLLIYKGRSIITFFKSSTDGVKFILGGLLITVLILMTSRVFQLGSDDVLSVTRRIDLNKIAILMWQDFPILGIGLNQFIYQLGNYWENMNATRFYQPAHNIYLLVLAELGAVGFVVIMSTLLKTIIIAWGKLPIEIRGWWIFISITGLFDHYWITLPATYYMFCLTLGLTLARIRDSNEKE